MSRQDDTNKRWQQVELSDIDLDDTALQFRLTNDALSGIGDLVASLKAEGQREPVDLVGDAPPFRIADGFRRVAAAQLLSWASIEAFVHAIDEREAVRLAFTKNVVRKNLSPLERAHAMFRAQRYGIKKSELASFFGLSQRQLDRYLELLNLPPHIQRNCDGKTITMAHAKVIADFDVKDVQPWKKRIANEGLDARALRRVLTKHVKKKPGRPRRYVKREKDKFRVYPFVVSMNAPRAEKERALQALEEVVVALRDALKREGTS